MIPTDTVEHFLEYILDFEHFDEYCANFVYIKVGNEYKPFIFNAAQRYVFECIKKQYKKHGYINCILLKVRQFGGTTFFTVLATKLCETTKNYRANTICQDPTTRDNIYTMAYQMHLLLPEELQMTLADSGNRSGQQIKWHRVENGQHVGMNTLFTFQLCGDSVNHDSGKGHGVTYDYNLFSEVSRYGAGAKQLIDGILGGQKRRLDTITVYESTGNGYEYFHDLFEIAEDDPEGEFIRLFVPAHWEDSYQIPFVNESERKSFIETLDKYSWCEGEKALLEAFSNDSRQPLTLEHLKWRRWKIKNAYAYDITAYKQSYPYWPSEAFQGTGNCIFNTDELNKQRQTLIDPETKKLKYGERGRLEFTEQSRKYIEEQRITQKYELKEFIEKLEVNWITDEVCGDWVVYKHPEPSDKFASAWDNAEGLRTGDYQAGVVIDNLLNIACEYQSHVSIDHYPMQILATAIYYNKHAVCIEKKFMGAALIQDLKKIYPYLTKTTKSEDKHIEEESESIGFVTSEHTRPLIIRALMEYIRENIHKIKSVVIIDEALRFVKKRGGKVEHEEGYHDDLLISLGMALQTADFSHFKGKDNKMSIYKNYYSGIVINELPNYANNIIYKSCSFRNGGFACIIAYYDDKGRLIVSNEKNLEECNPIQAYKDFDEECRVEFEKFKIIDISDPDRKEITDPVDSLNVNLLISESIEHELKMVFQRGYYDPTVRISTVDEIMTRLMQGKPALQIHSDCRDLIDGFNGKYYKTINQENISNNKIHISKYSNIQDALQNLVTYLNKNKSLQNKKLPTVRL